MGVIEEKWLEPMVGMAKKAGAVTAIDVGANTGEWTAFLKDHFATVIAVEPDSRAYSELVRRVSGRGVVVVDAAVGREDGEATLYARPFSLQSSLLEEHPIGASDSIPAPVVDRVPVQVMTLDTLLGRARQFLGRSLGKLFIKVDVEGAEGDVLSGATAAAFSEAEWLVEVHDRAEEVGSQFDRLGYRNVMLIRHPMPKAHARHFWVYAREGD